MWLNLYPRRVLHLPRIRETTFPTDSKTCSPDCYNITSSGTSPLLQKRDGCSALCFIIITQSGWLNLYPRGVAFTAIMLPIDSSCRTSPDSRLLPRVYSIPNITAGQKSVVYCLNAKVFTRVRTSFMWHAAKTGAELERRAGRHINNVHVYYAWGRN